MHAVCAMVATAVQSMLAFEHTDAAFTADTSPLRPTEPTLVFMRAPRGRLGAAPRQDDASDTASGRRLFIGRRAEAPIAGGQVTRPTEDRLMPIQRRCPQRDVGGPRRMDLVGGHDLMFGFLNGQSGHNLCPSGNRTSNRLRSRCRRCTMLAPLMSHLARAC